MTYITYTPYLYSTLFAHCTSSHNLFFFFFFNDPATTEIYTLSLHDAFRSRGPGRHDRLRGQEVPVDRPPSAGRSEEHTSELQSRGHLVCRLLLEKKKKESNVVTYYVRKINHTRVIKDVALGALEMESAVNK